MEIIFLLVSVLLTMLTIYSIGRITYSHKQLISAYKRPNHLIEIHLALGAILVLVLFITLCAFNNTFWHLSYLMY